MAGLRDLRDQLVEPGAGAFELVPRHVAEREMAASTTPSTELRWASSPRVRSVAPPA